MRAITSASRDLTRTTALLLRVAAVLLLAAALLVSAAGSAHASAGPPKLTKAVKRAMKHARHAKRRAPGQRPRPAMSLRSSRACNAGQPCYSCSTSAGCWPMLDLYAAGVVNVSVAGLPDTMALVAPEPDIYPRLSQQQCCMGVKQTVALRWGLQLKTGQLYWDDWYFATAFQDFTGDTSFLGYGGFGTPYHHGWNARDPRITKADLGWSTSAWYGRAGVPAGNGYRLRLQVAWYDRDGRAQANNQYAVPINGYGTDWDRWAYWNGVNGAGIGQWFVGR